MDELLAEFVAETREMLEAIEGELVAWEANPSDRARLDNIFRFVHTVKGNCGFFDFPRLEALSHAAESALAEVRAGHREANSSLVTAVLAVIDRITQMTTAIEAGEKLPEGDDEFLIVALESGSDDDASADYAAMQPAEVETAASNFENTSVAPRSIRLPVELLDRVMSGVSDMVLARNDLARRLRDAGNEPTLDGPFERLSGILTDVRDAITKMRMQRIEHLYNSIPRLVRDLSSELGKQVMVDFEGGDVELDREMIEMIRDPVTHLIRNAVDHGIERPSQRIKAGKREIGLLTIATHQSGNRIKVTISDDGAGLNIDTIGAKAIAAGLLNAAELKAMSDDEVANLIFEPGLSTAEAVTAVSGRGVGMDVVRANVERIGGTVGISTTPGEGTMFWLNIPLTLSIISALTVSIDGQRFAIPQSYLEEIAHGASAGIEFSRVGDTDLVSFRGNRIPCLTLNNVLGINPRPAGWDQRIVLLRPTAGDVFALTVDMIHDQEDLVIKPLAPAIMKTEIYAGATLLDDGSPVLLLDIPNIASKNGLISDARVRPAPLSDDANTADTTNNRTLMTFTDLDGRHRAIGMDLVTRIDEVSTSAFSVEGNRRQIVLEDRIVRLVGADNWSDADQSAEAGGNIHLLRLSDSETELAYAVSKLGETVIVTDDLTAADGDPSLEGVALIDGRPVPVIDGYRLFATHGQIQEPAEKPVCRLPENDEWAERMLRPLVVAAGYQVASADDECADVTIAIAGQSGTAKQENAGHIIHIHSDPGDAKAKDGSVYRYDRARLIGALQYANVGASS